MLHFTAFPPKTGYSDGGNFELLETRFDSKLLLDKYATNMYQRTSNKLYIKLAAYHLILMRHHKHPYEGIYNKSVSIMSFSLDVVQQKA